MSVSKITERSQYLTFRLDDEIFAIDVFRTREVLGVMKITKVPQSLLFMKGVINLRGSVVPVVDMRIKFDIQEKSNTIDTCIIVVEIDLDGEITLIGALVDSVKEVIELEPSSIDEAPKFGSRWNNKFITGIGKFLDEFIIILDIANVFSLEELASLKNDEEISQFQNTDES